MTFIIDSSLPMLPEQMVFLVFISATLNYNFVLEYLIQM